METVNNKSSNGKLVSPYRKIEQHTRISLKPYHMNSDIMNHMKHTLINKLEKKCNKIGYIDTIYRITKYSDGRLIPENLDGSAIYDISYHCKICMPVENTVLIGEVKVINQEVVVAINGPIMFFLPKEHVDTNVWDIPDGYMNKKSNNKLQVGNYIKIQIVNKRINMNDSIIKSIGKLLDFATDEEVDKYFGNKIVSNIKVEQKEATNSEEQTESNFIM